MMIPVIGLLFWATLQIGLVLYLLLYRNPLFIRTSG